MKKIFTLQFDDGRSPLLIQGLKKVWVYEINSFTHEWGLAFSDENWEIRTILISKDLSHLEAVKIKLLAFNGTVFYIK